MILHIYNDEKIINRTIETFDECFGDQNVHVIIRKHRPFWWVADRTNVYSRAEFLEHKNEWTFEKVFIHSLHPKKISLINKLNLKGAKIYWIIWGRDLYNNLLVPAGFKMNDPESTYMKGIGLWQKICNTYDGLINKIVAAYTIRFVENKVDYIVTDTTDNDYGYLIKFFPSLRKKEWKDFFYYPIDTILGKELIKGHVEGNNVIIGNSASQTNNHELVMKHLAEHIDLKGRKVIVPLSYSIEKDYVATVEDAGKRLLGDSYHPLHDFMPLDEYSKMQCSVSIAIYGNWRQEAIGNILISLYLGAKLFFCKCNPVYEWAISKGLTVYCLEDLTQEAFDSPLDKEIALKNREILKNLYCKERLIQLIKEL